MIFSAIVNIQLMIELICIECVKFMFFNMKIVVMFVLPKGDISARLTDFQPLISIHSFSIVDIVTHEDLSCDDIIVIEFRV